MTIETLDRFAAARAVADAVLYEGYVLYPYRASSRKNQLRWQFGVLTPRAFSEAEGSERWSTRTECVIDPGPTARLSVRIRFLRLRHRSVDAAVAPSWPGMTTGNATPDEMILNVSPGKVAQGFTPVARLAVDGTVYLAWDEAADEIVDLPPLPLLALGLAGHEEHFHLDAQSQQELIRDSRGATVGRLTRECRELAGRVHVAATPADGPAPLMKVVVDVENANRWTGSEPDRADVLGDSLLALHVMLAVDDGTFLSLMDPPERARTAVAACRSDGVFPVLIGADDVLLSSPIILYDHPEVAPESPQDLYDATEIDEILALRVLTLTDEEKAEARGTDSRAATIIDRCDDMAPEVWERLHGAMRELRFDPQPEEAPDGAATDGGEAIDDREASASVAWWDPDAEAAVDPWSTRIRIAGIEVGKGDPVRLRPSHRADAHDFFLAGMRATVAGVFTDAEGAQQIAVTIDDDPATAELAWQGRYLFFHPDEVEPITSRTS